MMKKDHFKLKLLLRPQFPFNSLSANPTKWSSILKQFVGNFPTNCLSAFDHFVGLTFKQVKVFLFNIEYLYYLEKNKTKIYCITSLSKKFCSTIIFYSWKGFFDKKTHL